jgi:hypothetical protein
MMRVALDAHMFAIREKRLHDFLETIRQMVAQLDALSR